MIYVGSAEDSSADQVLEEVSVGPIATGVNRFVLQTDPPDYSRIAVSDIVGVTIILVTCAYRGREFVRVGYYVANEYEGFNPEELPQTLDMSTLTRRILADTPRVTRFPIDWSSGSDGLLGYEVENMGDQEDVDRAENQSYAFSTADDVDEEADMEDDDGEVMSEEDIADSEGDTSEEVLLEEGGRGPQVLGMASGMAHAGLMSGA